MRCPACATDNPAEAPTCSQCGEKLTKASRRRSPAYNDKYSLLTSRVPANRTAVIAYRCAAYGLLPGIGLLLGPLAILFGIVGYRRFKAAPASRGASHSVAAIVLGSMELLSNGAGFIFLWIGFQSLAS
jgi:hypothetical protein